MTTEQQVCVNLFSNFILAILVWFLIPILTVTPAKTNPVMTPYITLLFPSPFPPKMWEHYFWNFFHSSLHTFNWVGKYPEWRSLTCGATSRNWVMQETQSTVSPQKSTSLEQCSAWSYRLNSHWSHRLNKYFILYILFSFNQGFFSGYVQVAVRLWKLRQFRVQLVCFEILVWKGPPYKEENPGSLLGFR